MHSLLTMSGDIIQWFLTLTRAFGRLRWTMPAQTDLKTVAALTYCLVQVNPAAIKTCTMTTLKLSLLTNLPNPAPQLSKRQLTVSLNSLQLQQVRFILSPPPIIMTPTADLIAGQMKPAMRLRILVPSLHLRVRLQLRLNGLHNLLRLHM